MRRLGGVGVLLALGLASCAKPPVVAMAPPPPPPAPVGHVYPVMVQVPPPPRRPLKPVQQAQVQQAFNVIALKSSLMVGALACNQQSQYDVFMTDFQPHILAEQHVMDAYFRRIGGYYGQSREDDFVTLMANNQSVNGIGEGAVFCLNSQAEFNQVLTFKNPADLDNFVTDQSPDQSPGQPASPVMAQTSPVSAIVPPPLKKPMKLADAQTN